MAYAEKTTVAVEKTIADIITLLKRAGAIRIMQFDEPERFTIQFSMRDRMVRFRVAHPEIDAMPKVNGRNQSYTRAQRIEIAEQVKRARARALMLVIKAKLESVESEVETFEQAFLANVVMHNDETVYERIAAPIAEEYRVGGTKMLMIAHCREGR
ncbi:hypothetical protein ASE75_05935 [Sphingomonas sp. Leaf17]|uniref:hypothetical protein n=1 Tax=Sphingomonas sp. Leaf17 TaxID=1735683 RepID=UPI0006F9941B|nr:hypothetical protein [Sphingomonas sp. Leaf17]KQM65769.1 hypothetical protein ASE75_05935 [Sphingomonas sp. Leaf17]